MYDAKPTFDRSGWVSRLNFESRFKAVGSREFLQRVKALAKGEARQKELFERAERSSESIKGATNHGKRGAVGTICQPARRFREEHCAVDRPQVRPFDFVATGQEIGISDSAVEDPRAMKLFRLAADYSSFKT